MNNLLKAFLRTKYLTSEDIQETKLHRCLSALDLTALGVGCTLGAGVYVVTGEVARLQAGPAIILSFTIAAIASILSGLCYAEFGARVPKAGSAYVYSYVTVGELCAFVIGWNMVLEYIVGASSVARAWSAFFDSLSDNRIRNFTLDNIGRIHSSSLSEYPDFLAFAFVIVITLVLIAGAKESSTLNWIFTILNIGVILFITIAGLVLADFKNWGNFMPYGFHGVMSGAATCFYSFIGFDVVATSGEETRTPSKSIPKAIIGSLLICYLAYFGVSMALTLMVPYTALSENTALATAFEQRGLSFGKYLIAVGAICGLSSSALDGLFPLPRILYSMASDGVIFSFFGIVSQGTGTPVIACVVSGLLTALLALVLDLVSLVEMMSIGTLLAYTLVALSVLLLRYKPGGLEIDDVSDADEDLSGKSDLANGVPQDGECEVEEGWESGPTEDHENRKLNQNADEELSVPQNQNIGHQQETTVTGIKGKHYSTELGSSMHNSKANLPPNTPTRIPKLSQCIIGVHLKEPTDGSYFVVKTAVGLFVILSISLEGCLIWGMGLLSSRNPVMVISFVLLLASLLIVVEVIGRQPQAKEELSFKVPLLPILPLMAIFINLYLVLMLSYLTWIRFAVWMAIGMAIYLFYGVKHSKENKDGPARSRQEYSELKNSVQDDEKDS